MPSSLPMPIKSTKFNQAEIALLKANYFKDLSDNEITLALKQCESMDLNPFDKEIYAYKMGGRLCLVTGISGFRKIAHRSGDYLGCKISLLEDKDGKIVSATAVVKKLVKNHVAEFEATVRMDEFFNENNPKWKTMPENQMRVRAEVAALKMGFPNIEQLSDETNIEPIVEEHEDIDVMPSPELESQEPRQVSAPINLTDSEPGEQEIKFKRGNFKIKELKPTELQDFLKWAYAQPRLTDKVKMSVVHVEEFMKTMEVQVDSDQEATKTQ